jgi:hypothetical protein
VKRAEDFVRKIQVRRHVRRFDRAVGRRDSEGISEAWRRSMGPLIVPGLHPRKGAGRLVVLPKVGGTEDVIATLTGRGDVPLELFGLPRRVVKAVFSSVLGPSAESLTDTDYRSRTDAEEAGKERYRSLLVDVVARLADECRIAGFMSANVTYRAEQELAAACEEVGIPFIVLHKEAIRTEKQRHAFTRAYRERNSPFRGRLVATYNETEACSQVQSGMVGAEQMQVVGCPRADVLHRRRESGGHPSDGPTVLFAIDPAAGTWTPFDAEEPSGAPRWTELAEITDRAFVSAALKHPKRDFVLKVKVGRGEQVMERFARVVSRRLPDNLQIVTGGTGTDLLGRAAAIIGFNSTVLLEGLASGVPVIVPHLAEASQETNAGWRLGIDSAVDVVESETDLHEAIIRSWESGRTREVNTEARGALESLIGNPDGRASDRAWSAIQGALNLR